MWAAGDTHNKENITKATFIVHDTSQSNSFYAAVLVSISIDSTMTSVISSTLRDFSLTHHRNEVRKGGT